MTPAAPRPRVLLVGGPDVDARIELMHLLAAGFEVGAVGSSPQLAATFAAQGFSYRDYPLHRRVNPLADLRSVRRLCEVFRELRPDIVHTFDTKPGVWGCIAARRVGVPAVLGTVTGLGSLYSTRGLRTRVLRGIYQTLQKAACRRSDLTIFQNHDDRRQLVAAGVVPAEKTSVILGSGVPTERYDPARIPAEQRQALRAELGLEAGRPVVTMIARVTRSKGVLEFVAAARALRPRHPDADFLLVGPADDGSLDPLTVAELQQLRDTVVWPGPRRDVATVLAVSDVFVLPSAYREGIPRVLLEAASMGLPLVTTDSPGCNEAVAHEENGLLVPAGDQAALTAAIDRLLGAPQLRARFGARSRQRATGLFDLRVIAGQIGDVYRRLLAARAAA